MSAESDAMFRYIVRIHTYRGRPDVQLCYTFINDHPRQLMSRLDSLELIFASTGEGDSSYLLDGRRSDPARLFQVDDTSYQVSGQPAGKRAPGWAAIGHDGGGMAVGVREFWQNWPKSLAVEQLADGSQTQLRVGICPTFPDGLYDAKPIKEEAQLYYYLRDGSYSFKIGVSRTHQLWATFFAGQADAASLAEFSRAAEQPLLAQPAPDYISETAAAHSLVASDATVGKVVLQVRE